MIPSKSPSRGDPAREVGITRGAWWSLQEIGVYTVGEVLEATDAQLRKARGFGPVRSAKLRRLASDYLERTVAEEVVPQPVRPADPGLLARPAMQGLVDLASRQDDRVRMVLMRDLGDGAGERMSWCAMARTLGISLPTLARARRRARDCVREDPLGMLLKHRIDAMRRSAGPSLGSALRLEPWAEGMPDRAVAMLARMLAGVDIDYGSVAVHS